MRKYFILSMMCLLPGIIIRAQSVGINSDGSSPHASAMLDVKSTNKGLLVPRITLTGTTDVTTISSPATGLLVYNTATAGSGGTAVIPGYYYYNGTTWALLVTGTGGWLTSGNSGTVDGTNFIGTTDNVPLTFKVNNVLAGRIYGANSSFGLNSLLSNTTGAENTAIGANALYYNTTGNKNTAIGRLSLFLIPLDLIIPPLECKHFISTRPDFITPLLG